MINDTALIRWSLQSLPDASIFKSILEGDLFPTALKHSTFEGEHHYVFSWELVYDVEAEYEINHFLGVNSGMWETRRDFFDRSFTYYEDTVVGYSPDITLDCTLTVSGGTHDVRLSSHKPSRYIDGWPSTLRDDHRTLSMIFPKIAVTLKHDWLRRSRLIRIDRQRYQSPIFCL